MFIGHQGIALAAKPLAPRINAGMLVLAANWLDLVWPVLLLLGIEKVEVEPGNTLITPLNFVSYPYSHSLAFAALWGVLLGALYGWRYDDRSGGVLIGLLVVSHWVLDLIVHRPDLPLYPGSAKFGLGLWNSLPATLAAEFILYFGGVAIYAAATRAIDRTGRWALAALVALLVVIYIGNITGPPPPGPTAVMALTFTLWLIPLWVWWIERHRKPRAG